ncbi:hypothetical protein ACFSL6_15385 [Paenibacillus thailandensis]|uniref:NEAT domain-containing protein n=1 Tax=Paenibacillus thailandensis TaxID=393250 RepID=A0ABW5QX36_9BACL
MKQRTMFKKSAFTMTLTLALALVLAIPAFAASYPVQFLGSDGVTPSTHASSYIEGGAADVTGSAGNYTVTLKLKNYEPSFPALPISYPSLKVDLNGDGTYETTANRSVSGSNTVFTFSGVNNLSDNVPVLLAVNVSGIHSTEYDLYIDWL